MDMIRLRYCHRSAILPPRSRDRRGQNAPIHHRGGQRNPNKNITAPMDQNPSWSLGATHHGAGVVSISVGLNWYPLVPLAVMPLASKSLAKSAQWAVNVASSVIVVFPSLSVDPETLLCICCCCDWLGPASAEALLIDASESLLRNTALYGSNSVSMYRLNDCSSSAGWITTALEGKGETSAP